MEKIIFLLIFCLLCFNKAVADEYLYWANLSNKNLVLFHEEQVISPAMMLSKKAFDNYACELEYARLKRLYPDKNIIMPPKSKQEKNAFVRAYKNELFGCFFNQKVRVNSRLKTNNMQANTQTNIRVEPLRFSVVFGRNSAIIYTLMPGEK